MLSLKQKRTQILAILTVVAIGTGISAPQAKAIDIFGSLAGAFGYADLYTSATGLYAAGSGLYNDIAGLTINLGTVGGALGIPDPSKLFTDTVAYYSGVPVIDFKNPDDINAIAQRVKAAVAAKVGSAPLTELGQTKAIALAQQNANLAAASHTAANNTQTASSSLEAIQKSAIITDGLAQMIPGLSTQLLQSNQTAAAGVQISGQIGNELTKSNIIKDFERREINNRVNAAGNFLQPLFTPVP